MSNKQEDANLILKLYELRREAVMRQARNWFVREFHPASAADVMEALKGEKSAYVRMVTTYWEMAATLVLHGAIDSAMFHECNGEHVLVFVKLMPFLDSIRKDYGNPRMMSNLEKLVRNVPNSEQTIATMTERLAAMANSAKAAAR